MKRTAFTILVIFAFLCVQAFGQNSDADKEALKEALVKLEKQSWEAWKARDGKFYEGSCPMITLNWAATVHSVSPPW